MMHNARLDALEDAVPDHVVVEARQLEPVVVAAGADVVELATEEEFKGLFPGCEPGAMPPFGNLYGMKVFVSPELREDEEIAFNAGSHTELIRLSYADFERLVQPRVTTLSRSG